MESFLFQAIPVTKSRLTYLKFHIWG